MFSLTPRSTPCNRYISKFPLDAQRNFDAAVDNWQVDQVLKAHEAQKTVIDLEDEDSKVGSEPPKSLLGLPSPHLQLLFGSADNKVVEHTKIRAAGLQDTISNLVTTKDDQYMAPVNPTLVKLGLLPSLITLASNGLNSPQGGGDHVRDKKIRQWARTQINACGGKPVKPLEWVGLGLAEAWSRLLSTSAADDNTAEKTTDYYRKQAEIWKAALAVIESGSLHPRTLEEFVLGSGSPNVLALVASRIADKTPGESLV